jgi:hypothetical protein
MRCCDFKLLLEKAVEYQSIVSRTAKENVKDV